MTNDSATGRPRPIAIDRNATDRQQPAAAPKARREAACRWADELSALYQHAPIGLAVLDRDLRFIRINQALAEINGYSAEEHLGRTAWEIVPGLRETAEPLLRQVLGSGEAITGVEISGETAKQPGVRRHWREQFYPIKAPDGSIVGVGVICEEVSAGKRAAAALAGSEARYQAIVQTAVDGIIVIDEHGLIRAFNPAAERIFGYASGEVIGRNVKVLMAEEHARVHDSYLAAYRTTGVRKIIGIGREVVGKRRDGSVLPLDLAIAEWRDAEGARFFTGMIRDITERKRSEEALRQSQKMEAVGQLTGGVAHDFNNLLTAVLGNLEMLEERLTGEHDRLLLREAQEAAHSGAELTRRLLAFARRQPLDPRPVDLRRQVDALATLLRRTLGETIEFRTIVPAGIPLALVDPGQLQNALLNLALNARDAMPGGGTLVLEAGAIAIDGDYARAHADVQPGAFVMLSVTDTGIGMTSEIREQAFEPFFTTKQPGTGTGLGLAMVYGFVKQSGGHAQIYSEPGQGTTVRLYLPQAEQSRDTESLPETSTTAYGGHGEVVLVVEDDPRVRRYAVAKLGSLGYQVVEAADGPAAEALVRADAAIDLLFTDVVMPGGMSGRDLAEIAREALPDLRVILTSGYAAPKLLQRGMAEGGRWLRKPYTALELARAVRETLDGVPPG